MTTNEQMKITIITTGGTIEKIYDEKEGSLQNRETIIKNNILERLRLPYTELDVRSIMSKDSLEMDDNDRLFIFQAIERTLKDDHPVVILHGTDTMEQTARYCYSNMPKPKHPVVFTGAMRPLEFENSDAKQNVVEALFAARHLPPGFYICFHGRAFSVPNVRKNRDKRTFEAT